MLNLSFTVTPKLKVNLDNIDHDRIKIVSHILSREDELKLRWRAKLSRTHASLSMSGNKIKRRDAAKLLSSAGVFEYKYTKEQLEYIFHFEAQDYINNYWYVNQESVLSKDVYTLYKISSEKIFGPSTNKFKSASTQVQSLLDYIDRGDDHPVIKAGIIQMQLRLLSPFTNANGRVTRLCAQLFFYKYGYDMRGMLVMDEYWKINLARYKNEVEVAEKSNNLTGWLEFFTEAVSDQTKKIVKNIASERKVLGVKKTFWALNKRQKKILSLLENPEQKITNADVQRLTGVSQITASRDLAHLLSLNLVLRHGKGRSVFYTRV